MEELEKLKPREKQEVMDSMAALFNNIALCAIQQSDYSKVI